MTARAGALLIAACLALGCGDNIGGGADAGGSLVVLNNASDGHQHTLTIPCTDVAGDMATTYTTTGGPDHEHAIELSAEQHATLATGGTVTLMFTDGHPHTFVIVGSCGL